MPGVKFDQPFSDYSGHMEYSNECQAIDIFDVNKDSGSPDNDSFDLFNTQTNVPIVAPDMESSEMSKSSVVDCPANMCPTCRMAMAIVGNFMICGTCGLENKVQSDADCSLHYCPANYSSEYTTLKLSGRGAYAYQRSIMKTCTTHQAPRRTNILRDMNRWNVECDKYHVPKNVIQQASDMYNVIRSAGYVYRGGSREGVMGNCIYYACYMNGITKTPTEIAQFTGIEEKFISQGSRILHKLHELGVIQIPTVIDPISDYLDRFIDMLGVPRQFKAFLLEIIEEANTQRLHVIYDSKNLTKCAGAIYLLADRIQELRARLSKEEIERVCQTSRMTFVKYTDMLLTHWKLFIPIYKRRGIPMRNEWAGTAHRAAIKLVAARPAKPKVARSKKVKIVTQPIER